MEELQKKIEELNQLRKQKLEEEEKRKQEEEIKAEEKLKLEEEEKIREAEEEEEEKIQEVEEEEKNEKIYSPIPISNKGRKAGKTTYGRKCPPFVKLDEENMEEEEKSSDLNSQKNETIIVSDSSSSDDQELAHLMNYVHIDKFNPLEKQVKEMQVEIEYLKKRVTELERKNIFEDLSNEQVQELKKKLNMKENVEEESTNEVLEVSKNEIQKIKNDLKEFEDPMESEVESAMRNDIPKQALEILLWLNRLRRMEIELDAYEHMNKKIKVSPSSHRNEIEDFEEKYNSRIIKLNLCVNTLQNKYAKIIEEWYDRTEIFKNQHPSFLKEFLPGLAYSERQKKLESTQDKITDCFPSFSKPPMNFRETLAKWKNVLDQLLEKGPGNKPDNCWNFKDYKRSKSFEKEQKEKDNEYKMKTRTYKKKKDESSFDPKKISYKGTFI